MRLLKRRQRGGREIPVTHHAPRFTFYAIRNLEYFIPLESQIFFRSKKFTMTTIPQTLATAIQHHQAGNLQQAEQLYRQILQVEPHHPDALHLLGVIAHQLGNNEAAIHYIDKAISVNPSDPNFHSNLGAAYQAMGELDAAVASYRQALNIQPDLAEGHYNLGSVLQSQGKLDEAAASYRRALRIQPNYPETHYNLGNTLHEQGQLDEAIASYCRALKISPSFAEAHNNLGNIFGSQGKLNEGVASYQRALKIQPDYAEAHNNLGVVLREDGKLNEAAASFQRALQIQPDYAEAHSNLGNVLQEGGKFCEAVTSYQQALQIRPDFVDAHYNLGLALQVQGKLDEAIASYQQTVRLQPDHSEAYYDLGNALKAQGKPSEAVECYRWALKLNPDFAQAHNNLGVALQAGGKPDEAMVNFQHAIHINPNFAEAYCNLGNALQERGMLDEAVASCRQALRIHPDFAQAHNNLGVALQKQGKLNETIASFQRALQIQPDYAEAHNNLGNALQEQGTPDEAAISFQRALQIKPDYAEPYNNLGHTLLVHGQLNKVVAHFRRAIQIQPDYASANSNLLLSLNYDPDASPESIFAEHRRWGEVHACISMDFPLHGNVPQANRRLRIGYVSPDFRTHSVAFFIEPILAHRDREQVEVICYAEVSAPDATTTRLGALVDGWRSTCGLTDAQVAEVVRADEIDILVDLAGHTANNRLLAFARKPAPVQVTYGYASTTGLKTVDYRLTDAWVEPHEHVDLYTEELVYLPHGFLCYAPSQEAPEVEILPAHKANYITFGSFNNLPKVNSQVVALWAKILLAAPEARLILKSKPLNDEATRERYFALFEANGISRERVDLIGYAPSLREHLALYNQVDIGLDAFPYSGQTSTCEALWMGVPVVTLAGETYVNRAGVSLLARVGLTDLIADTPHEYMSLAVELADDINQLSKIRASLRSQMAGSPLCDGKTFTRGLEAAYRKMWQRWCEGAHTGTDARRD